MKVVCVALLLAVAFTLRLTAEHEASNPLNGREFFITSNSLNEPLLNGVRVNFAGNTMSIYACNKY
jgi:hypothetical protein